jgi:NADPH:quinone reductase-like Zn-dependent oxidoreductase
MAVPQEWITMKRAQFNTFGSPAQVVSLIDYTPAAPGLGQIGVKLLASPINPADFLLITGQHAYRPPLPAFVGIEGVGIITALGAGVESLAVGDHVLLPPGGNWSEHLTVEANAVYPVPRELDPLQAAMLSVNPVTAVCLLTTIQKLQPGDWVLQNAANSAVGRLIVRLAAERGLRTVNVVRRAGLEDELKMLGADVVLVGETDLPERVTAATGRAPLRLALDAIAGASAGRLLSCLTSGGTLVTYGLLSGEPLQLPAARIVFDNVTVTGFSRVRTLQTLGLEKARALIWDLAQAVMRGTLVTEIEAVYPFAQITSALAHAEQNARSGKILLKF